MPCGKSCKAYFVGGFSAIGGFLFGYHTGVISGLFVMDSFTKRMKIRHDYNSTIDEIQKFNAVSGGMVGILLFGCFLGSLIAGQTSDRFSRKYSIAAFSIIFTVGAALQTFSQELVMFFIGRFVAGISIGALSMIIPIYHSEIAATKVRGRIVTFQQLAITIGIAISFWINVATVYLDYSWNAEAWRVPLGLQIVPSVILAIGILFCPFSPRWLISQDREDEARNVLVQIRSASHNEIEDEMNRIRNEVAYLREYEIDSYRQLFCFPLLRPLILGISIQVLQQLTGINSTMYYAPRIFTAIYDHNILVSSPQVTLILTGINGCVNVIFTIPTLIFIDKFGRRILLICGAIIMSISMLIVAILIVSYGKKEFNPFTHSNNYILNNILASWITLAFICIFIGGFAISWGPIPWVYCTEIFPLTMRAKATSLTTAANWATNCAISFLVPALLDLMQFGIFIMFSIFCVIMLGVVYFCYPETKDIHLEENYTNDGNRLFVPQWLENRRRNYNTFSEQPIVNQPRVSFSNGECLIDGSNQTNNSDSTILRDDCLHETNLSPNETVS